MMQALNNRSLRARLILSSVLCILVPLVLSFLLMNKLVQEELVQLSVSQSEDTLEVLDIQMSDYFDNLLYLSNYIQFSEPIKAILNRNIERSEKGLTTPESNALDDIEISRNLEGLTNLLVPSYLAIVLDHGYTYTNHPNLRWADQRWEQLYAEFADTSSYGIHWIGLHPNYMEAEKEQFPYLISIAGVVKLTEKHKALQMISIHEENIRTLLKDRAFDSQQEIMLVDANGMVLSHNQHELIESGFPYYEQMKQAGSYHVVQYHQKDYLMVSHPFSYGDWSLVSLVPQRTAVGNIQKVMGNTLFILLFFFLLFLILLVLIVSLLTKPLKTLNKVIKQVRRGNLNVRSGLRGRGDIEQLGHSLDTMMDTIEHMIEQIKTVEKSKRKAELEMLQAQINPHFLFNTLNSLRLNISMNGDQTSSKLIQSLTLLLRMTFNRKNEFVPLKMEIEVIRHYLKLMNFKSNSSIDLTEDLEPSTLEFEVPCFFLQPLIENSILHGFEQKSGTITIMSKTEGNGVEICVADNGKGLTPDELQLLQAELQLTDSFETENRNKSSFTGIGIGNVYQRMHLIYGYKFQMKIENSSSGGTQTTFFIPGNQEV